MTKEEKLSKINLLKSFCVQNGISEEELNELSSQMQMIKEGSPFDIYYEDGEITRRIDLTKNPIAFKIQLFYPKSIWLTAHLLKDVNFDEAKKYMESLPKVSTKPWKMPCTGDWMTFFRADFLWDFERIQKLFCISDLSEKSHFFGCLDKNESIVGLIPFDFCGFFVKDETDKLNWWPMCDADRFC